MARTTVAELEQRVNSMDSKLEQIIALMQGNNQAQKPKESKPKKADEWLEPCPAYATDAQKVEYDKLAKRAAEQRDAVMAALGTKSLKCFIPVPKRDQTRMPHSIQWKATYSK